MPWTRLDPEAVANTLRIEHDPNNDAHKAIAAQALAHLREQLQTGFFIAVQDHEGRTFIGTPDEAAEHMMTS